MGEIKLVCFCGKVRRLKSEVIPVKSKTIKSSCGCNGDDKRQLKFNFWMK